MLSGDLTALVALIVSLVALICSLLQVAQQYLGTASEYRHCSQRTVGGWYKRSVRRFVWKELRFEVLFTVPIIHIGILRAEDDVDIYSAPSNLSTSESPYILRKEGNKIYSASENPWFLDLKGTTPEAKCTWLSLLNDAAVAHLQIDIDERTLSYDFMPDGIKKPLAQMDRKSFLTLMSLFQVSWRGGWGRERGEKAVESWDESGSHNPTGAGPYCEVTSHNLINFGIVVSYHLTKEPARRFYMGSERARSAMFSRFDLGFHVLLTHSAEEVYQSVLGLADDKIASNIRDINRGNNGWSPGLAELIGCFAEPEMPKAIEHGTDQFTSIFSSRSIGCILYDYPVLQLLIGEEKIENSTDKADEFTGWVHKYFDLSSPATAQQATDLRLGLPTEQLLAMLKYACSRLRSHQREDIPWSTSRKCLDLIKALDNQATVLCGLIAPMQPEQDVQREFARQQVTLGSTLLQDTAALSHQSFGHGGSWRNFIGPVVAGNYLKICSALGEKYPQRLEEMHAFMINRLMRGVMWVTHNANGPSQSSGREFECSLNSRWLSDTSTIWID